MAKQKAAEQETTTALAKQDETSTALAQAGINLAEDFDQFQSNFTREDFQMPFLQVLQALSPQVQEGDGKSIEGARPGMILETATNTVYDVKKKPLRIIVVSYRKTFVEWIHRDAGGGFVKDHGLEGSKLYQKCTKDEKNRMIVPGTDGKNQLVETMQYVVLYEDADGNWMPAVFALVSTQLKKGRVLNTTLENLKVDIGGQRRTPPFFYSVFTLTTVPEKNNKGQSWMGYKLDRCMDTIQLDNGTSIYVQARDLRKSVDTGAVDMSKAAEASGGSDDDHSSSSTDSDGNSAF